MQSQSRSRSNKGYLSVAGFEFAADTKFVVVPKKKKKEKRKKTRKVIFFCVIKGVFCG